MREELLSKKDPHFNESFTFFDLDDYEVLEADEGDCEIKELFFKSDDTGGNDQIRIECEGSRQS